MDKYAKKSIADTKIKNWCQNGVNQEKVIIIRKKKCCKPCKIKVCKKKAQKNLKKLALDA